MGYARGTGIFCAVADALVALGADEPTVRLTLAPLIDALNDADWDTQNEAIDIYRANPVILSLFAAHGCPDELDSVDSVLGVVGYDETRRLWTLDCGRCGPVRTAVFHPTDPARRDLLVGWWAIHAADLHGGPDPGGYAWAKTPR